MAWLETSAGRVESVSGEGGTKTPTFPIMMGTNYEVVRYI